ncbi:MAG: polysaccharide deacetylase family protein [Armatimonadetes bacterium]|nr:polysaccharide deacetylase family protein [Armatimonadota bacterium]
MSIWSLIGTILSLSLGLPPDGTQGAEGPSHLDAHLRAQPPGALVRPLGTEDPGTIPKGLEPVPEGALTTALLAQNLHSRLLRVGIASNGWITAGLVKLQVGDKQSELISIRDLQQDVARVITTAFATVPDLAHLDCWATVPGEREFTEYHRPVLSVSVTREEVADLLGSSADPAPLLARCGCVRVDDLLLRYAIDAPDAVGVRQLFGEALQGPSLQDRWTEFGAQARPSGELDNLPREGPVSAIVEGDPASARVALTIDDGPHPLTTPLMLDVLRRWGVHATFFLVGENAEQFPELVRLIARDGHEIGNHTYSHISLTELNPRGVWTQLRGCDQAIEAASGVKPRLMRPPGGDCSELALRVTDHLGYETALWTANSGDWRNHNREAIVANGLSHMRPGSIILMHQGDLWSLDALPYILQGIRQAGLEVGTVSDVVGGDPVARWEPAELVALAKRAHTDPYEQGRRSDG